MAFDIEVTNLTLQYGKQTALNNLSFKLETGKIYGLLGRNGAGKTSFLSILASFRPQTTGTITINGEAPFENAKMMQHVIFIYQRNFKEETDKVKQFLQAGQRYRPHFDMNYAEDLIKKFKLPLDKPINKLSKGMQSALSVTLGLASRAPITIFDEAYLGMDAPTRDIFYKELLEDQQKHPRTIILSTHLVSEMDYLFDEVLIIDKGTLLLHEDYESLVTRGAAITGAAHEVDDFVRGMRQLNVKQLGNTKSIMVYGELSDEQREHADQLGLEIGSIPLQDLFIHLTREDD